MPVGLGRLDVGHRARRSGDRDRLEEQWGPRPVEPHFVHFPDAGVRISGIWAEAAVDGLVVFERDLEVSRWLAGVRRRIVAGQLVRREAHGQPYWIDAS